MTYLEKVSGYIVSLDYDSVPEGVKAKIKTSLLYALVMGLTGYDKNDGVWQGLVKVHPEVAESSLLVHGQHRSVGDAAFINAALMCLRGQNDTFPAAVAHGGCVAIPAVLALAEREGSSGRDILIALVAGYEVLSKLASPTQGKAVAKGFRSTSVFGVFCSAAAAAKLLKLDRSQTAHALSIASQFSAGTMQCWEEGTPEWRLQVGHASRAGLMAALAAQAGVTASALALEGKSGFYKCFCGEVPALSMDGWTIEQVVYKPFPGCLINQGPIHALRSLMAAQVITSADIQGVTVSLSTQNGNYPGIVNHGPFVQQTGAVMSAAFMLEVMLQKGTLKQKDFESMYGDNSIHAASERITVKVDSSLPMWACIVEVALKDGRVFSERIEDQSCFAYQWDEVVGVLDTLVDEWPFEDAGERYATMKRLVRDFDTQPGVKPLLALCIQ